MPRRHPARPTAMISRRHANISGSIWSAAARAVFNFTTRSGSPGATRPPMRGKRWRITISSARRTFLGERAYAFLDLGAAHAVAGALIGGRLVELAAGDFVDGALHAGDRHRRVAGKQNRQAVNLLVERLARHHGGEIADPQHFRRADLLGGQKQLFGVVGAKP